MVISTVTVVNAADVTISPDTPGGINEAVKSSKNGDTIFLENGVYKGKDNTNIVISNCITIKGLGSNVVIDGENKNQFFNSSGARVSINKLKFTNGYSTFPVAVIHHKNGNLTLEDCFFTNNKAYDGS